MTAVDIQLSDKQFKEMRELWSKTYQSNNQLTMPTVALLQNQSSTFENARNPLVAVQSP